MDTSAEQYIVDKVGAKVGDLYGESIPLSLTAPPEVAMGDFALECFPMAKLAKKAPAQIAQELAAQIATDDVITFVQAMGPYLNFKVANSVLFGPSLQHITAEGDSHGFLKTEKPQKIMVEYLSPNTNKPLHLGHMRNGYLGTSVIALLKNQGHEVIKACIINDRGISICKSMLAWKKWGNGQTPEQAGIKPDHFVGDWYVRFAQEAEKDPALIEEAQAMLLKWESGDPETVELWKLLNSWVYAGWATTEQTLGFTFDRKYYESEVYQFGKDIIEAGVARGVLKKTDAGAVVFDLPVEEFGLDENKQQRKITLIRADGTSVYITQDIGLMTTRAEELHLDQIVMVVGSEQSYHFQTLFAILKALGYEWAKRLYHLSYGLVMLPEGKMKSREGTVVDADDLMADMVALAAEEIRTREHGKVLSEDEIQRRAHVVGLGAIRFFFMRTKPNTEVHFDPKESISFDGFTGPYVQYAHARACSIIRQAEKEGSNGEVDYGLLGTEDERALLQKLKAFSGELTRATNDHNPSAIAVYVFEVAKTFNHFYSGHPVVKAESPALAAARLVLVKATAQVIKNGLAILGIEAPEEM